MKIVPNAENCV